MSRVINVHIDDATEARLNQAARETGRAIEQLADDLVAEGALNAFRSREDDPGSTKNLTR